MILRTSYGLFFALLLLFALPMSVQAQEKVPPLPAPLENMVKDGAQVRYLGKQYGMEGWIAILRGQEQYFYVTPDREAFLMGLMFNKDGKMVTLNQVQKLQLEEGETLDAFASPAEVEPSPFEAIASGEVDKAFKTPAEQLFADIEGSNWVRVGQPDAPVVYSFIDPQCPYCHEFIKDLRGDYLTNGMVQVRMIPVGFRDETRAQAAFLLSVPSPQDRWFRHLDGDESALPVSSSINQQGVQKNLAIMQSWKLNVTPLSVYRAKNGEVKIVQGRPKDLPAMLADIK
jgi:thiol:disulfide interchange protein DsbG